MPSSYLNQNNGGSIVGRMGINQVLSDGLRFQMSDADPGAAFFHGFAVGSTSAPSGTGGSILIQEN